MRSLSHVYLADQEAYVRLVSEVAASPSAETGGILVGRFFALPHGHVLVVVAASGPGKAAQRSADYFEPDSDDQQRELEHWRTLYAAYGVDYVGQWHTHPLEEQLSPGDMAQIRAILNDPSYSLPHGIFTPIVTYDGSALKLAAYFTARTTGETSKVPLSVLEGDVEQLLDLFDTRENQR